MGKGIPAKIITVFLALCIIFPATICFADTAPSFSVSVTSAGQKHKVGDVVTFTVGGQNIKDMYAFEAVLVFDPDVLQYESSKLKLSGGGLPVSKVIDNTKAVFAFTRIGTAAGENGDRTLCELKFKVLAEGKTSVKLGSVKVVKTDKTSQSYMGNTLSIQTGNKKEKFKIKLTDADLTVDPVTGVAQARVDDALLKDSFDKAPKDDKGGKTVEIILPKKDGVKGYEQVLPASFFKAADLLKMIEINTDTGVIAIPGNMLSGTDITGAADMSLTIAKADKTGLGADVRAQIGDRPVIELSLKVSGKSVPWNSHTSKVTVSVPYKPTAAELQDTEHIAVWYLDGSGKPVCIPSGRYDPATGMVTFVTNHFSAYAVTYVNKTFTDLSGYSWASREIGILASKGVINGVGESSYAPAANITRADFMALLVRTLGLNAAVDNNFGDVYPGDYYYNELGIAKKLGVTVGTGNNRFNPNAPITRQDMIVMAAKAMKIAGKLEAAGNPAVLDGFTDKTAIASYAAGSVAELVEAGLVLGSNNRINPMGNATRAEIAVLMYRIYNTE